MTKWVRRCGLDLGFAFKEWGHLLLACILIWGHG